MSSTQQMVDRLVVQTQETIKTLAQESTEKNNDINFATGLIQDADNSKQVRLICIVFYCLIKLYALETTEPWKMF